MGPSQSDPAPNPAKVYFPSPEHLDTGDYSRCLLRETLTLSKRLCKWRWTQGGDRKEGMCFTQSYLVIRCVREEQDSGGKADGNCSETEDRHPNAPALTSSRRGTQTLEKQVEHIRIQWSFSSSPEKKQSFQNS